MSNLLVQNIKHTNGTTAQTIDSSGNTKIAGHVAQVIQATFSEQGSIGSGSATTLINQTFTPKFSDSKFLVSIHLPNCTSTDGEKVVVNAYIGTSSTPASNTNIINHQEEMGGTGADDTRSINNQDYGSFTASSTSTHYVSLTVTPDATLTVARHATTGKLILQEVAQ